MKIRTQYIILIATIAVLGLYILVRPDSRIRYTLPTLPLIHEDNISRVEYQKGDGQAVSLTKAEGQWLVGAEGFRTDQGKISQVLSFLENGALTDLVASNASPDRFGLGPEEQTKLVLQFASGVPELELHLGSLASGNAYTFASLAGSRDIYLWRGNGDSSLPADPEEIRDRRLSDLSASAVTTMAFKVDETTWELTLNDEREWVSASGEIDEEAANVLSRIIGLRSLAFLDQAPASPIAVWSLGEGEAAVSYRLYASDTDGEFILDSDFADTPVTLAEASLSAILEYLRLAEADEG